MRRLRRSVIGLLVFVGLLVAADRITSYVSAQAVAERIQAAEQLPNRPGVDIDGFPFLSQVVAGHYDEVRVTVTGLVRGDLHVSRLVVDLRGAHVPLRSLVGGHVDEVPVDHGSAQVFISFADLNASLRAQPLSVGYGGTPGAVSLSVGGVRADASLAIDGNTLSAEVATPLGGGLRFSRSLPSLPFGVHFIEATSSEAGITIAASADSFTIPA